MKSQRGRGADMNGSRSGVSDSAGSTGGDADLVRIESDLRCRSVGRASSEWLVAQTLAFPETYRCFHDKV